MKCINASQTPSNAYVHEYSQEKKKENIDYPCSILCDRLGTLIIDMFCLLTPSSSQRRQACVRCLAHPSGSLSSPIHCLSLCGDTFVPSPMTESMSAISPRVTSAMKGMCEQCQLGYLYVNMGCIHCVGVRVRPSCASRSSLFLLTLTRSSLVKCCPWASASISSSSA